MLVTPALSGSTQPKADYMSIENRKSVQILYKAGRLHKKILSWFMQPRPDSKGFYKLSDC